MPQRLTVAVALSLTLLIGGVVELGTGIQHGDIQPPHLEISFGGLHIVAKTIDPMDCWPYTLCHGSSREYYEVWVSYQTAPEHGPEKDYGYLLYRCRSTDLASHPCTHLVARRAVRSYLRMRSQ